jgi:hypothetical protein
MVVILARIELHTYFTLLGSESWRSAPGFYRVPDLSRELFGKLLQSGKKAENRKGGDASRLLFSK